MVARGFQELAIAMSLRSARQSIGIIIVFAGRPSIIILSDIGPQKDRMERSGQKLKGTL